MKKVFLTAWLLVPFFSHASFLDDVNSEPPETVNVTDSFYTCKGVTVWQLDISVRGDRATTDSLALEQCKDWVEEKTAYYYLDVLDRQYEPLGWNGNSWEFRTRESEFYSWAYKNRVPRITFGTSLSSTSSTRPPVDYPSYTILMDGMCYDPFDIHRNDSCNFQDGAQFLDSPHQGSSVCYTMPDDSQCQYDAAEYNGSHVYELNLEGDCYSDTNNVPDFQAPELPHEPLPHGTDCLTTGTPDSFFCTADPDDVCLNGDINNCTDGCGTVGDTFGCFSLDTDGDGNPDVSDPDIDNDGITNENDTDSDGDGVEDPVYNIPTAPPVNLGNLESKTDESNGLLSEIKDILQSTLDIFTASEEIEELDLQTATDDYQTKIDEITNKTEEQLGFSTSSTLSSSSMFSTSVPDGQCKKYTMPVGGFTYDLDTCFLADKINPFLTWFTGFLTAWYIFRLVNRTIVTVHP